MENNNKFPVVSTRLSLDKAIVSDNPVTRPKEAIELAADYMFDMAREVGVAIFLDETNCPLCMSVTDKGDQSGVRFNQEEVLRTALLCGASKIVALHNHISRDGNGKRNLVPSKQDVEFTYGLMKAASYVGLILVDSIIVTATKDDEISRKYPTYYSMRAKKFRRMVKDMDKEKKDAPKKESDIIWEGPPAQELYDGDPLLSGEGLEEAGEIFNITQLNIKKNAGWYIDKNSVQLYEP